MRCDRRDRIVGAGPGSRHLKEPVNCSLHYVKVGFDARVPEAANQRTPLNMGWITFRDNDQSRREEL